MDLFMVKSILYSIGVSTAKEMYATSRRPRKQSCGRTGTRFLLVPDRRRVTEQCRWPLAQGTVRTNRVVVLAPHFNDYLCLPQRVEELSVEALIPQLAS